MGCQRSGRPGITTNKLAASDFCAGIGRRILRREQIVGVRGTGRFSSGVGLMNQIGQHLRPPGGIWNRTGFPRVNPLDGSLAEGAVTFELRFAEPLVAGGFVRKLLAFARVIVNVARCVAQQGGLDVDERSLSAAFVGGAVVNFSDRAVSPGFFSLFI